MAAALCPEPEHAFPSQQSFAVVGFDADIAGAVTIVVFVLVVDATANCQVKPCSCKAMDQGVGFEPRPLGNPSY